MRRIRAAIGLLLPAEEVMAYDFDLYVIGANLAVFRAAPLAAGYGTKVARG